MSIKFTFVASLPKSRSAQRVYTPRDIKATNYALSEDTPISGNYFFPGTPRVKITHFNAFRALPSRIKSQSQFLNCPKERKLQTTIGLRDFCMMQNR